MRITVTLDDTLYQQALEMADPDMERPISSTKSSGPSYASRQGNTSPPWGPRHPKCRTCHVTVKTERDH